MTDTTLTPTKTDCEIIAEFMGFRFAFERGHRIYYVPGGEDLKYKAFKLPHVKFQYETSWEWLMPVVEKISRHVYDEQEEEDDGFGGKRVIKYTAFPRTFGMLSMEGKIMVRFNRATLFEADTLIDATYQAVVDWIRWYNNQAKN